MENQVILNRIVKLIGDVHEELKLKEIDREKASVKLELASCYVELIKHGKNSSLDEERG